MGFERGMLRVGREWNERILRHHALRDSLPEKWGYINKQVLKIS